MAYRKPFTPRQRREAIQAYRSYRKHQSLLRRQYPPQDLEQRQVLQEYREVADAFGKELTKPDSRVNPDTLNYVEAKARWLMSEYWRLQA